VSDAATHNAERRARRGIEKLSDVEVPLRDGASLLADVYRPVGDGRHPVILRLGIYGRAFGSGSLCDDDRRRASEEREDSWFEHGPPDDALPMRRFAENAVSANAFDWVPRGYVCVRVDGRGVGTVPGVIDPFSCGEANDYYDVIEWAARQPWSNGAVALFGASYHATIQWNVASLRPPSLKAIVPWAGDGDPYRELSHPGGIFIRGYREMWVRDLVMPSQCDEPVMVDVVERMASHPFDEPQHYGREGDVLCGPDYSAIDVPVLTAVNIASDIHGRAGAEAFNSVASPHAELVVADANYWEFMYVDCIDQQFAFLDRHLKGDSDAPVYPPVRMIMRTGQGEFEWREDRSWPPEGTTYLTFPLDAAAGAPPLGSEAPAAPGVVAYAAQPPSDPDAAVPGAIFDSEPLASDMEIAGHVSATVWVSSTSSDMDVFATLRVLDPSGAEVAYAVRPQRPDMPLAHGALKVSQRALDAARSTPHRPWHTHRRADRAPLRSPDEVVPVEIELSITTARIPAGHRLRLELQPIEARTGRAGRAADRPGLVAGRAYDNSYHDGAENRIHTGPDHPSQLRIPVVPRRPPWVEPGATT
jgi:predicted acyl esterase